MIISRIQAGLVALLVCALALGLVWQTSENRKIHSAIERVGSVTSPSAFELSTQLDSESRRLMAADAVLTGLLERAQEVGVSHARSSQTGGPISAKEALDAALGRGTQLIKDGKFQEALDGYLECYRELHAMRPGTSESQRLMGAIKSLGPAYPAAMTALGDLRDSAMRQLQAQPGAEGIPFEIALLNERLGEGRRTLAVFDSLAASDRRRQTVAMVARDSFVEAQRYQDAFLGKPYAYMLGLIEGGASALAKVDAQHQPVVRKSVIEGTLTNIEVLTGAGRADDAQRLTEKLLSFDNSDATRAQLKQRIERATRTPVR